MELFILGWGKLHLFELRSGKRVKSGKGAPAGWKLDD